MIGSPSRQLLIMTRDQELPMTAQSLYWECAVSTFSAQRSVPSMDTHMGFQANPLCCCIHGWQDVNGNFPFCMASVHFKAELQEFSNFVKTAGIPQATSSEDHATAWTYPFNLHLTGLLCSRKIAAGAPTLNALLSVPSNVAASVMLLPSSCPITEDFVLIKLIPKIQRLL